MLLKELHKENKIFIKDLLLTPVGLLCYIVDCLNSGLDIDMVFIKASKYNICLDLMLEIQNNSTLIGTVLSEYKELQTLKSIFNLC